MCSLRVDIWSDIACPWCYVGKRRLEAALEHFPHRQSVDVVWRAFELDPAAPRVIEHVPYVRRLARKYGTSIERADAMVRRMTEIAAGDGLEFRFDRIRPGNTFDAHRLLHLAAHHCVQDAVKERLLHAYMTEGAAIGERETLSRLAVEAGLDADEVKGVLGSDAYAEEVRADEGAAHAIGIHGVPFFVVGGRYAISGAQSAELLLHALTKVWHEGHFEPELVEGSVCGPEGCD